MGNIFASQENHTRITCLIDWQSRIHCKMEIIRPITRIFLAFLGDTWDDGIVPLHPCLTQIVESWQRMGLPEPWPIHFTFAEIASHERQFSEYTQRREIQEIAQKYLDTDAEGWIPPGADWVKKRSQIEALLELMIERLEWKLRSRRRR